MFIAGPAFNAGRYGYACANVALAVQEELGIPVLTGMYIENPGADLKNKVLIYETANSAAGMRKAAPGMAKLALKLMKGEEIGASCEEGYMPVSYTHLDVYKRQAIYSASYLFLSSSKLTSLPTVMPVFTSMPVESMDSISLSSISLGKR